jgi:hypothetical protein
MKFSYSALKPIRLSACALMAFLILACGTATAVPSPTPTQATSKSTPVVTPTDTPVLIPSAAPSVMPTDTPALSPPATPTIIPTDTSTSIPSLKTAVNFVVDASGSIAVQGNCQESDPAQAIRHRIPWFFMTLANYLSKNGQASDLNMGMAHFVQSYMPSVPIQPASQLIIDQPFYTNLLNGKPLGSPDDGTNFVNGLQGGGADLMAQSNAQKRILILLTDGIFSNPNDTKMPSQTQKELETLRTQGVTVFVVLLCSSAFDEPKDNLNFWRAMENPNPGPGLIRIFYGKQPLQTLIDDLLTASVADSLPQHYGWIDQTNINNPKPLEIPGDARRMEISSISFVKDQGFQINRDGTQVNGAWNSGNPALPNVSVWSIGNLVPDTDCKTQHWELKNNSSNPLFYWWVATPPAFQVLPPIITPNSFVNNPPFGVLAVIENLGIFSPTDWVNFDACYDTRLSVSGEDGLVLASYPDKLSQNPSWLALSLPPINRRQRLDFSVAIVRERGPDTPIPPSYSATSSLIAEFTPQLQTDTVTVECGLPDCREIQPPHIVTVTVPVRYGSELFVQPYIGPVFHIITSEILTMSTSAGECFMPQFEIPPVVIIGELNALRLDDPNDPTLRPGHVPDFPGVAFSYRDEDNLRIYQAVIPSAYLWRKECGYQSLDLAWPETDWQKWRCDLKDADPNHYNCHPPDSR